MTQTQARDQLRDLLNQTNTSNTQYDNDSIDDAVSAARRAFAVIMPESLVPNLRAGDGDTASAITVTSGYAAYPSDFLRRLKNKRVQVNKGGSEGYVRAIEVKPGQEYIIEQAEDSNSLMSTDLVDVAYYRETGAGIEVWPNTAADVKYPYLKAPGVLDGSDNSDLPDDIEDLTILHAFERLMGTKRGDLELAVKLARDRGFNIQYSVQE